VCVCNGNVAVAMKTMGGGILLILNLSISGGRFLGRLSQ